MSAFGGIQVNGTAPTGGTYTTTISNNTITLTNNGTTSITGIDFGYGIATGTIVGSNNTIVLNQNAAAANSAAIIGIRASYTSASNTQNANNITINQNTSAGALTSPVTGITVAGVGTTVNVGSAGNGNTISIRQNAPTGTGSYGSGAISFVDVSAASGTINVVSNTFNTTGSTIRSTGTLNVIAIGGITISTGLNITNNIANIDRVATTGIVNFFNQSSTSPNTPSNIITGNSITFTNLATSGAVTAIQELGGSTTGVKNINNNI